MSNELSGIEYDRLFDRKLIEESCGGPAAADVFLAEVDGPFLVKSHDQYENSKPRVVIVGQENNGWIGSFGDFLDSKSVADALQLYEKFNLEQSYGTTFFRYFASIRRGIFGESENTQRAVLWLNLFKFNQGMNPQMVYSSHRKAALALQGDLFQQEVRALEPDAMIFLTGPYYDDVIRHLYQGASFVPLNGHPLNQLAKIEHADLPAQSYRTYHPGYLSRFPKRTAHCVPSILSAVSDAFPSLRQPLAAP